MPRVDAHSLRLPIEPDLDPNRSYFCFCLEQAIANLKQARIICSSGAHATALDSQIRVALKMLEEA